MFIYSPMSDKAPCTWTPSCSAHLRQAHMPVVFPVACCISMLLVPLEPLHLEWVNKLVISRKHNKHHRPKKRMKAWISSLEKKHNHKMQAATGNLYCKKIKSLQQRRFNKKNTSEIFSQLLKHKLSNCRVLFSLSRFPHREKRNNPRQYK